MKKSWLRSGSISLLLHAILTLLLLRAIVSIPQAPHASLRMEITSPARGAAQPSRPRVKLTPPSSASALSKTPAQSAAPTSQNSQASSSDTGSDGGLPTPAEDFQVTQMPELGSEVRIPYPPDSKSKGIQGAVVMDVLIDENGRVRDAVLIEGPAPDLSAAALQAVRGFQFKPARVEEKRVAVRIHYAYRFVIEP